jgi:uncharacterized protein YbjT (DUF2867 family)
MNAIIAGASGLVGRFLLNDLLSRDRYERVIALVRSDLGLSSPKLSTARVDFAALDSTAPGDACAGADLFCTLGTTIKKAGSQDAFRRVDHDAVLAFARWGLAHGARRFFVVTALGADAASSVFYNRVKGEVERDIASLGFAETHVFRRRFFSVRARSSGSGKRSRAEYRSRSDLSSADRWQSTAPSKRKGSLTRWARPRKECRPRNSRSTNPTKSAASGSPRTTLGRGYRQRAPVSPPLLQLSSGVLTAGTEN